MATQFRDIVSSNFNYTQLQRDRRAFGFSPIQISGQPGIYHPGDVVQLNYDNNEISTTEAMGLAWAYVASGGT